MTAAPFGTFEGTTCAVKRKGVQLVAVVGYLFVLSPIRDHRAALSFAW